MTTALKRQPLIGEELTVEAIREKIPRHYHKQRTLLSLAYVAYDMLKIAAWSYFGYHALFPALDAAVSALPGWAGLVLQFAVYNVFWWMQGLFMTGLWVLAHECGHGGFSSDKAINEIVGWILHSALLVPYHNWRITHATHHRFCNHLDKDTVFIPEKKEHPVKEALGEAPLLSCVMIGIMWTLGWPFHLLFNFAGREFPGQGRVNHFEPSSPLFLKKDRINIIKGNVGLCVAVCCVYQACQAFGASQVVFWYGAPYLWVNFWLVSITFLQHTDPRLPHYTEKTHNFTKGALATIDRSFGSFIDTNLHHIQDSHVAHHLFSSMPFYHAIEVTRKHLPQILGDVYIRDEDRSFLSMMWASWRSCNYVVPSEDVAFHYSVNKEHQQ